MQIAIRSRIAITCCMALAAAAQTASRRPLSHRDYDSWRTIQNPTLSRDGKFLAYALFPEEGDGELVIRDLVTGKETRESAGSVPPAPDTQNFEAPAVDQVAGRGLRIVFTADSRYLLSNAFPKKSETDQAKKDRKSANEMPKTSMLIVDLAKVHAGSAGLTRVEDVASYGVPENAGDFVAYLKGANSPATPATGRGGSARRQFGSTLCLRDLSAGAASDRLFEDVVEYVFAKDGRNLVYTVSGRRDDANGVYAVNPGASGTPVALLSGKGKYSKITFDFPQRQVAFVSDHDDPNAHPPNFKAYLWQRTSPSAQMVVSAATAGFRSDFGVAESGPLSFSRDGARLYVSCAPLELLTFIDKYPLPGAVPTAAATAAVSAAATASANTPEPTPSAGTAIAAEKTPPAPANAPARGTANATATAAAPPAEDKLLADLWSWRDDYIQPMQKVRATQERGRTYRGMYNIAEKRFVQLADPTMPLITPSDDGRLAVGNDDRAYRHMVDYDGTYSDVYLIDTATGARKLAMKQVHGAGGGRGGGMQWSPDGSRILVFKDKDWYSLEAPDGRMVNLTAKLGSTFIDEDHDTPDTVPAYGTAGWIKGGTQALVYDRFDVWSVAADGSGGRRLTSGRAAGLQFRVARLDVTDESEDRGIDPSKPVLFRAENLQTRDTGIYSLSDIAKGQPEKKMLAAKNFALLSKAKDADVILLTASTFREQPDLQTSDGSFKELRKVSDANPQQAGLNWGTGELVKYRNADGVELQAAVYKPENFDPKKKYPMMVYIYERLTQNVNTFVRPAPGHSINIAYYVSNGYIVLTPDIVYTTGHPGQSALKCVLPAVQSMVEKGYVDKDRIGIQGHSWGGYQIAYMVTQTNVFRAAEAGAPVADMISAYDGIRWGTGLPRQFQYEKTQSRIGGTLWEYPLRFIENSPIFMADRIATPMLILQNDGDDAVPWYQGVELFLALRRLGKEVYLFDYNGEPHGLRKRAAQKDYAVRLQQYFDHFLKGAPEPEWMAKGIPYIQREQEKEKFNAVYSDAQREGK